MIFIFNVCDFLFVDIDIFFFDDGYYIFCDVNVVEVLFNWFWFEWFWVL